MGKRMHREQEDQKEVRKERDIFGELAELCTSPGYAHTIAFFCSRDNVISHSGEVKAPDLAQMFSKEHLSRSEIATLIGLLVKKPLDLTLPTPDVMQEYIARTEKLLAEIHLAMSLECFQVGDWHRISEEKFDPFQNGLAFREPIFYGGESAYGFQYRDLALLKYTADDPWLLANKGFDIATAQAVVRATCEIHHKKLIDQFGALSEHATDRTFLSAYCFTTDEVAMTAGVKMELVQRVLTSFALPETSRNDAFNSLSDFNATNAYPLIKLNDREFLLFQPYTLLEALYDSPFYWMQEDKQYRGTAANNRGRFVEQFIHDRLARVFGERHVHSNVTIHQTKARALGEIDVLVVFADRAIVVQAKSKRLTVEARKGNDLVIKEDFKKGIQIAYDQGRACASMLTDPRCTCFAGTGEPINPTKELREIYILCIVSDHYPALSFQARQFLKYDETAVVRRPLVLDVFALDVMTEMLQSPLHFLSYINRRTLFAERLLAQQELTILAYHLKHNLWINDKPDLLILAEDFSAELDIAMSARRDGVPGKSTPDGILTRFAGTTLWRLIVDIEREASPVTTELGLLLLAMSGDAFDDLNMGIDRAIFMARRDRKTHDVTVAFDSSGLTIHCTDDPNNPATLQALQTHCAARKYKQRANKWFGVCIGASDARLRFGIRLEFEWTRDAEMDEATKSMRAPATSVAAALKARGTKVGRNDPCPCGSGNKYKRCCLKR